MKKTLKIALCGASGSGKTTLAKELAKALDMPFIENSAGLIVSAGKKADWGRRFGYQASGHADVIRLSNIFPEFGLEFQAAVLESRIKLMDDNEEFIIDRSPIDNIVYFLLQCGPNATEEDTHNHLACAYSNLQKLDGIIYVSYDGIGEVEDNKSRIKNIHFQRMVVNPIFEMVIHDIAIPLPILEIRHWDFDKRLKDSITFIRNIQIHREQTDLFLEGQC